MSPFLTVKEAAKLTGKSPSSIRRILYPIIQDDHHADRSHIEPSVEQAMQLRMKGENFAWRVSEDLLHREIPPDQRAGKGNEASATRDASGDGGALVAMLQRELDIKNQQITQQMTLISGLSERLREGNILMGSLQQQLALTDGRKSEAKRTVEATGPNASPEKGSETAAAAEKPKRGFLGRFFR